MTTTRMNRFRHALAIATLAVAAAVTAAPAATAAWNAGAFMPVQQKGAGGGDRDRGDRDRGRGRDARQERPDDRRSERMSEDDRRSLHRDLDKANRELYGRGVPK